MKKYDAKAEIMKIFNRHSDLRFNSKQLIRAADIMGVFLPSAFNTHLSQLMKSGRIERTGRGEYQLNLPSVTEAKIPEHHKLSEQDVLDAQTSLDSFFPDLKEQLDKLIPTPL